MQVVLTRQKKLAEKAVSLTLKTGLLTGLMALSSYIKVYLPYSPVPVTLQTLALFLGAVVLGRNSWLAVFSWVLLGCFGLPVFAAGAGISYLLGPTAGYIMGFILAGYMLSKAELGKSLYKTCLYF